MNDRIGLLNPKFKYTRAAETDISKTFTRIRREQKEAQEIKPTNVKPLKKAVK